MRVMKVKSKSLIFLPFLLKMKSFHQFMLILLGRTVDFLVSDKHSVEKFVAEVFSGLSFISVC